MLLRFTNLNTTQKLTLFCALIFPSISVAQESPKLPVPEQQDQAAAVDNLDQLLDMADKDIGNLANVKVAAPALETVVTTVARKKSTVGRTPAAVFVISNDMIRRSGARSIPEVLRMAQGVQVARLDSNKWAVSIRGFNNRFSNKLLVQIDGRSVYTPLFAGVFWDVQDVLLEDVERIEVIRGPGATVWGKNAVNGVINIITKKAKDTQGTFIEAGGGTERAFSSARVGGKIGEDIHYRVYGKWFERDEGFAPANNAHDDWRMGRGGFRMDWTPDEDRTLTFQGDYYDGYVGRRNIFAGPAPNLFNTVDDDGHVTGGNLLLRYSQVLDEDSDFSVQFYYDRTERHFLAQDFEEDRDTIDFDFQHRFKAGEGHSIVWGAGYRYGDDRIGTQPFFINVNPIRRETDYASFFIQDEITLAEDELYLTLGTKIGDNDFTEFEIQPSARLLWTPTDTVSIWTSVSRAVRIPSRGEEDARLTAAPFFAPGPTTVYPLVLGNPDLHSEKLIAYEFGIREQVNEHFSWDLAAFFHDYEDLVSQSVGPIGPAAPEGLVLPLTLNNNGQDQTYGFELASTLDVSESWRLTGAYSFLRSANEFSGADPRNQLYLQSSYDLGCSWELDLIGRYVDALPRPDVDAYFTMDTRLSYRPNEKLELFLVGRHLLDREQPEFSSDPVAGNLATEVKREVFGGISLRY